MPMKKRGGEPPMDEPPMDEDRGGQPAREPDQIVAPGGYGLVRREVSDMVEIALTYPRDERKQLEAVLATVEIAPELAEKNWYSIPYKKHNKRTNPRCNREPGDDCEDSPVEGISVKGGYTLQRAFRHLATKSYIAEDGPEMIRIVGVCRDLQNNTLVEREYSLQKVTKYADGNKRTLRGKELDTAIGAATSKAIRNAVLNAIPDYWVRRFWDKCREVDDRHQTEKAGGDKKEAARVLAQDLKKHGVTQAMIERKFGKKPSEMTADEADVMRKTLRGYLNAINNGDSTVDDIFGTAEQGSTVTAEQAAEGKVTREEKPVADEPPPAEEPPQPTAPPKKPGGLW